MCQLWALHVVIKRQFFYIYIYKASEIVITNLRTAVIKVTLSNFALFIVRKTRTMELAETEQFYNLTRWLYCEECP